MGKRKIVEPVDGTVEEFVSDAFSDAEGLKDELQSWWDNLPENFQNGDKGDALQEAIDALDGVSQPDVPDCIATSNVRYTPCGKRKASRADRLGDCIARLENAAQEARDRSDQLEALHYNDDGKLINDDDELVKPEDMGEDPATEEERNSLKDELDTFADECDDAKSEWENVSFPGMY